VNSIKTEEGYPLVIINLGDSRAFIGSKNSTKFNALTNDHKPTLPEEIRRIEKAGAKVYRNRINSSLAVSRAFGDSQYKDNISLAKDQQKVIALPDVSFQCLKEDEFLFICCDGIFESFSNAGTFEYLFKHLSDNQDLAAVLSEMLTAVLKGGSLDNMSAMLIQLADGCDYNKPDEYLLGTYYPGGNESYKHGFRLDCEKHGLIWEEVEKNLSKSGSEISSKSLDISGKSPEITLTCDPDHIPVHAMTVRTSPLIVSEKQPTITLKTQTRNGSSKSYRQLMPSPSLLTLEEPKTTEQEKNSLILSVKQPEKSNHETTPVKEKEKPSGWRIFMSKSQKKEKSNGFFSVGFFSSGKSKNK